jgi:hypothetical protein
MYLILFFAHKIHRLQSKYSPFAPENAAAASSNYSKAGPGERMDVPSAKALNREVAAQ